MTRAIGSFFLSMFLFQTNTGGGPAGGGGGTSGVAQITAGAGIAVSPAGGTGTVAIATDAPHVSNLFAGNGSGATVDSGIAPNNVLTLTGTQTVTGAKTFPGATFLDKVSVTSTGATTTIPTVLLTDNEAGGATMIPIKVLSPNQANNTTAFYTFGQAESTNNSFLLGYVRSSTNGGNKFTMQAYNEAIAFTVYAATGNVGIGPITADAGYKLDILGSLRTQTLAGSGTTPTVAAGAAAGTSPTGLAVTGSSTAFSFTVTTGSTPAANDVIATVTYPAAYASAPRVVCQATSAAAAGAGMYITKTTTTAVLNVGTTALTASTAYSWDCHTIQ